MASRATSQCQRRVVSLDGWASRKKSLMCRSRVVRSDQSRSRKILNRVRKCSVNDGHSSFKKMQIVRGCDEKRNVLVYLVYSDKLIEGSPKNSTLDRATHALGRSDAAKMWRLRRKLKSVGELHPGNCASRRSMFPDDLQSEGRCRSKSACKAWP